MRFIKVLVGLFSSDSPSLLAVGRLAASLLTLFSAPIVARAIGPEGRGETAAAIAVINLLPVLLALGIPAEVRRLTAIGFGRSALARSRWVVFVVGSVASAAAAWVTWSTIFADFDANARIVATIGVLLAPLIMSWQCDVSVLIAQNKFRVLLLLIVSQQFIYLASVICFWVFGVASTATIILANLLGVSASFLIGISLVRPSTSGGRERPVSFVGLLRGALKFAGAGIAEAASYRLDQVLALPLIGAYNTGLYAVATTIGGAPLAFGHAISASYYPKVARSSGPDRAALNAEGTRIGIATGLLACVPLGLVTPLAVPLLFGADFAGAIAPALIALVGTLALIGGFVAASLLAAAGRCIVMTMAQVLSLGVGVGLLFALGPTLGAVGASVASTISYLVLAIAVIWSLRVAPREIVPRAGDFKLAIRTLFRGRD